MLMIVGLTTWAISGVWLYEHGRLPAQIAWLVFACAFLLPATSLVRGPRAQAALLVQSGCAIVMGTLSHNFPAATLAIVAGQLPFFMSTRATVLVFVAQTTLFAIGLAVELPFHNAALLCGSYVTFEGFICVAGVLVVRERRAREALAAVNAELRATQAVLEHSSRELERQHVSRELHDVLGHHLTALSLQLEVAKHLVEGRAVEPVLRAHELAKGALAEVRQVASSLRDPRPLDVSDALEKLVGSVPGLSVHLELDGARTVEAPRVALAVVRCVQEAVTNAARHSGAKNHWLTVNADDDAITVTARDDGRGASTIGSGSGLSGLRARMSELGGELAFETRPGHGFTLSARIPLGVGG
jgi:signal transduction histidine kinase